MESSKLRWVRVGACLGLLSLGAVSGALAQRRLARRGVRVHTGGSTTPEADAEGRQLLQRIAALDRAGKRADAPVLRQQFLQQFPESWQVYRQQLALGGDLALGGRPDLGIQYLTRMAGEPRSSGQSHAMLATAAQLAVKAGDPDQAIQLYRAALAHPTLTATAARSRYRQAVLLRASGQPQAARDAFATAQPGLRGRMARRAAAHLRILEASVRPPATVEDRLLLARAHLLLGERRGAEQVWARAAQIGALRPEVQLARADNLAALGETTDAARLYNQLRSKSSAHPAVETAMYRWARLMSRERGALRQARVAFLELLRRYPRGRHEADAWLGLGDLEVKAGRYKAAQRAYRKVLSVSRKPGKLWAARLSIGWCWIRRKQYGKARRHFDGMARDAVTPEHKRQVARGLKQSREGKG